MVLCLVTWLTYKRVAQVCQHQRNFLFYGLIRVNSEATQTSFSLSLLGKSRSVFAQSVYRCNPGWVYRCASGCWVPDLQSGGYRFESRPGYFAPRSTQPSIHPGSANEYQLRLGRQRQVWLPIADERVGVQVKLWNPFRTRAISERFCGGDSLRRGAI